MPTTESNSTEAALRPSAKDWEALLQRILESSPFRRSPRLREFLIYVGNEVVLRGAEDIHEQQIGMAVFGRSPSYDTSADNIVRVTAMELRKRIELYFATEGQNEILLFEIPRGSYSPIFHLRQLDVAELPPEAIPCVEEPGVPGSPPVQAVPALVEQSGKPARFLLPRLQVVLLMVIVSLATLLTMEIRRDRRTEEALHRWQTGPALAAFWGNFFGQKMAPEIVLADTSYGIAEDVLHQPLSLSQYLDYSYRSAQPSEALSSDARQQQQKDLSAVFSRNSGSIGDFRVARRITELETGDYGTRLSFSREYAAHRMRWSNTIFIGSSRSNPWVELFNDRVAYHFKQSNSLTTSVLTVDNPTGKEQPEYVISSDPNSRSAYCVIVFLPNPTSTGNTLIIAGSDSQATEAGGDFLTSNTDLERLRSVLHQETFPYFQVLLRIVRSNGTPLESEIVSYRIIRK